MLGTNGAGSYTALRTGFSGITGASNLQLYVYWSSTEDEDDSEFAWDYNFNDGSWGSDEKVLDDIVRACLAF